MENGNKKGCCCFDASKFWMGLALFLLGVVSGFFLAPIKKGMIIGSYNCGGSNDWDFNDNERDCCSFKKQ